MPDRPEPPDRPVPAGPREAVQRWRLVLARGPLEGEAGQREQLAAWERALAGSRLPIAGLDAVPPRPRFAAAAPLAAAVPGEAELVDVWVTERLPAWRVREALAGSLPPGHALVDAHDVWLGEAALPGQVAASVYRATFAAGSVDVDELGAAIRGMLAAPELPRERRKGQGSVTYDLRPFVDGLELGADGLRLWMTLRHDPERGIGRPDEVLAELAERVGHPFQPVSIVRERLVLAPPPKPDRPPGAGRPRPRQSAPSARRPTR